MASAAPSARELTSRLIARVGTRSALPDSPALAAQLTFQRAYRELVRSLGPTGFHAIVGRALVLVQTEHPLLKEIRIDGPEAPTLDRVTAIAHAYGAPAVAAGIEAWLEAVLDLVGQLIGFDVVAQLVEQRPLTGTRDDEDDR